MSAHTPGPWQIDAEDSDLFGQDQARFWINADGMHVGYVDGPRNVERTANARLIAAAPELLAAARTALGVLTSEDLDPQDAIDELEQAIAKAMGVQA